MLLAVGGVVVVQAEGKGAVGTREGPDFAGRS